MEKTQFLKEISIMTREDISKYLNQHCKRVKKIYPVVFLIPEKELKKSDEN